MLITCNVPVINKHVTFLSPITIQNPNGTTMTSSHDAELPFPDLPPAAHIAHIVPDLTGYSLVSVG
jgi:hypothetical protein